MGETLDIKNAQSVTAKSSPDSASKIDLEYESGRARNAHETVSLAFHGNHSENVYLVQNSGNTPSNDGGIVIPQGTAKTIPNLSIDEGPQYLWASSNTSVTVTVIRGELDIASNSSGFIKGDVQVDGVYNDTPSTASSGDRVDLQTTEQGVLRTQQNAAYETSSNSVSTTASWQWETHSPTWDFLIGGISLFLEETGNSNSVDFQVYGTTKESPASPSGSDPDDWFQIVGTTTISAGSDGPEIRRAAEANQITIGYQDGSGSGTLEYDLDMISAPVVSELEDRLGPIDESPNRDATGTDSGLRGLIGAIVEQNQDILSGQDANDQVRVDLQNDNLATNLDVDIAETSAAPLDVSAAQVDVDDSGIGDEGTASQEADSTIAATVIDRLTALVDTLNSGQADDEVRVDLAADTLSGDIDVDDSAVGDETTASQQSDSTLAATVIERLTALVDVLNSGQADDEVRVDLAADTLANDFDVNLNSENVSPLGVENRSNLGTQNDISLSNGGTTSVTLSASGAHSLAFAADGGSDYSVDVEWQDGNGTTVVTQADVVSNTGGGVTTFDTRSKSSQAVVTLTNDSGGTATYSLSAYFA